MVSIVVPVYNAANYIEKTIEMVCRQTYKDWELILVDDASRDESAQVIENYIKNQGKRIRLIRKKVNQGAAEARNTGIDASAGRYIAFLDADDLWQKDKLEKQLAFMKEKNASFSFTGYEFADENATPLGKVVKVPEKISYNEALRNTTIFTSTVMFDMSKLDKDDVKMPHIKSEDTALWWQLLRNGVEAYGLNDNLVYYRRPSKSLSSNKFEAIKRIWKLYREWEHLSIPKSIVCFTGWAFRAVKRRI